MVAVCLLTVLLWTHTAGAEVAPGDVITKANCQQAHALLAASMLEWVCRGDLSLMIGRLEYEVVWEPSFAAASRANAGRYAVDAEGNLIDPSSGERPAHTYGLPFAEIADPDPQAAVKIMWNTSFAIFKSGSIHAPFAFHWVGQHGEERRIAGEGAVFAFDGRPAAVSDPDRTEVRDLTRAVSPASVEGLTSLSWRYMDERPDSVWSYLPAMRRVRQLSAANRSDPMFGSDFVLDDGLLWAGKHQSFTWKLAGQQEVLVPAAAAKPILLEAGKQWELGREWRTPAEITGARFGWETPGWQEAPWIPAHLVWVKRPVWIVEGRPKDPYYDYGRQVFYIDRVTFKIYYKIVYTRSGEYWKTLFNDLALAVTADGSARYVIYTAAVAVDDRTRHATQVRGVGPDDPWEYGSSRLEPDLFSIAGLLRLGK